VVKSLQGYGGEEVHLLDASSDFEERLREVTDGGKTAVMIQEYLPSVTERGDRRIIVLGGEPIGGLTRMPADGDFRANLHVGGRADDAYVTETERDLCRQIRPYLVERGLHLVGLDLIDNLITEINVTSPTCVQEINRLSDRSLETEIVDYVEETLLE
jgi:glutathione synthase